MISDRRKLLIQIGATAYRNCNKEELHEYADKFVKGLNPEEVDYALSLFERERMSNKLRESAKRIARDDKQWIPRDEGNRGR